MTKCLTKILVILPLFYLHPLVLSAESSRADSLITLLNHSRNDTCKVELLIDIADELIRENPENAKSYAEKAILLATKLRFNPGIAAGYNMLGSYYYQTGDFKSAFSNFNSAKTVFEELEDREGVAISNNNLGGIQLKLGYYKKGLRYFILAAECFEEIGKTYGAVSIYNNIAIICRKQNDLDNALKYYNRALSSSQMLNDDEITAGILHNIGSVLHDRDKNNEALSYLNKAFRIRTANHDDYGKAQTAQSLGVVWLNMGNPENALKYLSIASELFNNLEDLNGTAECLNKIGVLKFHQKQYAEACTDFEKSFKMGKELGSLPIQQFALSWLASIDSIQGNLKGALSNYQASKLLSDSILNQVKNMELTQMRLTYEKERLEKEKQLQLLMAEYKIQKSTLQKNRYLLVVLILSILFFSIIGITLFQRHKIRMQKRIFRLELDKLRQQLDPHFLFNSLNSIQSMLYSGNKETINNCLNKLAKLMRMMLDSTQNKTISLHNEVEFLSQYLDLMKIRFKDKFNYKISVDESIDQENFRIPSLVLQPYIENSIYHGLKNKKGKGNITIEFFLKNNHLHCNIEDDGIGRISALEIKQNVEPISKKSYSTIINQDRFKLMNQMYGKDLGVKFIDLTDSQNKPMGTRVELDLPILLN